MAASLALLPSSLFSSPPHRFTNSNSTDLDLGSLKLDDDSRRKTRDSCMFESDRAFQTSDLNRQMKEKASAPEVFEVPERGMGFSSGYCAERPFGEGYSSSASIFGDKPLRFYSKGLVSELTGCTVGRERVEMVATIGVAICDVSVNLLLKIQKPLVDDSNNLRIVELKASMKLLWKTTRSAWTRMGAEELALLWF